jgi:hypothetical protein
VFYFWRSHYASVSGSTTRRERCVNCSCIFEYDVKCHAQGGGHAPFLLGNGAASVTASQRAYANLSRALKETISPVHCPRCGIFQPNMVRALREQHGVRHDPNRFASERLAVPAATAWQTACAANTVEAYNEFINVWPTLREYAERQIRELKYPPHLQKRLENLSWLAYAAVISLVIGIVFVGSNWVNH